MARKSESPNRIDEVARASIFRAYSGKQSLQPISWDEFFEKFDERGLPLLYQDLKSRGQRSNFN
jgi:hypothetical protein